MSEKNPSILSAEDVAELRSHFESITQNMRWALANGTSLEGLKTILVGMGFPKELVETKIEKERVQLRREAALDRDFEAANMWTRLELIFTIAMREGDLKTALEVVKERARLTGAAMFVKYSSGEPNRVPSEFEKALDEIGGPEREILRQEMEKKVLARAKEMREKDAAEKKKHAVDNENPKRSQ